MSYKYEYAFIQILADPIGEAIQILLRGYENAEFSLADLQKHTNCDTINIVRCARSAIKLGGMERDLLMVIDDNGKIFHKPINHVGTLLYGNPQDFIVGDVLLGWTNPLDTECEPDIYPMPYNLALAIYEALMKQFT